MNDRLSVSPEMAILLASLVVQGKRLTRIFRYLQKFLIIYLVFFSAELGDLDEYDDFPDSKSWRRQAIERIKELDPILPDHITQSIQEMTVSRNKYIRNKKKKLLASLEARLSSRIFRLIIGTRKYLKAIKNTRE